MSQIRIRDAGGILRTPTRIRIRDAGGVLQVVQRIRVRDAGNVLRTVYSAFSISASPSSLLTTRSGATVTASMTTGTVTVTATGTGPFTYSWSNTGAATSPTMSATAPSAATTAFTAVMPVNADIIATWTCTVTDGSTGNTLSTSLTAELSSTSGA
jgi:hypothetical protein